MHIVIDRVTTLKTPETRLAKPRQALELESREYRVKAKVKALEVTRNALREIEAYDPEADKRLPEVVLRPLPHEARQAPQLGLGNIEHAIAVLRVSSEVNVKLNEHDVTAQTILLHAAKAA